MTLFTNNAEGGSNGTGVTVGNSGGTSGTAWSTVDTTSGSVTYSTTGAYSGSLGYAVVTGASSTGVYWVLTGSRQAAMRCYFYVTALPSSGTRIMSFLNSGLSSNYCAIALSSSGVLTMLDNAGATKATSSGSMSAGVWYRCELKLDNTTVGSQTASFDAYLGDSASAIGTLAMSASGVSTFGGGNIATAYFGKQTGGAISTVYYDLCAAADSVTAYIGPATTSYVIGVTDDSGTTEAGVLAENVDVQASDDAGLTDSLTWAVQTTTKPGPAPTPKIEVEFTAGVWTDVSADVDWTKGVTCTFGRQTIYSMPKVASIGFELSDAKGWYTAKNPSSPYYPNVVPHKRVRYTLSNGTIPRFLGYIKGWPPTYEGGTRRIVSIQGLDRFDQMSRENLRSMYQQEVLADSPAAYWPFSDSQGTATSSYAEVSGHALAANWTFNQNGPADTIAAGASQPLPFSDAATGVQVTANPTSSSTNGSAGLFSTNGGITRLTSDAASWECWFSMESGFSASFGGFVAIESPPGASFGGFPSTPFIYMQVQPGSGTTGILQGYVGTVASGPINFLAQANVVDGNGHHFVLTTSTTGSTMTVNAYLDGALIATATGNSIGAEAWSSSYALCQTGTTGTSAVTAGVSNVALYRSVLSPARVLAHYQAGAGTLTETTGARIRRLLGYAGLTSAEWNVATGAVTVGPQDTAGKSVVSALQAIATTEGSGSAVFVDTDGRVRFIDAAFRNPTNPAVIFDALGDLDGPQFSPTYDDSAVINDSTVTRFQGAAQHYADAASVTANGMVSDSATSYASTDASALNLAQDRVTRQSTPRLRVPQLVVDHITATTGGLYAALANMTIGTRQRLSGIPTTETVPGGTYVRFPYSQMDVNVEGWTETGSLTAYILKLDVSLADSPARGQWDDPVNGRWQPDPGSMTVSTAIVGLGAGITLAIATAAGHPTFSTSAGDYPLNIQVDDEVITLSAPPGGSTSPQTWFGVGARGANGTIPAAHSIGAAVTLYPNSTWGM